MRSVLLLAEPKGDAGETRVSRVMSAPDVLALLMPTGESGNPGFHLKLPKKKKPFPTPDVKTCVCRRIFDY